MAAPSWILFVSHANSINERKEMIRIRSWGSKMLVFFWTYKCLPIFRQYWLHSCHIYLMYLSTNICGSPGLLGNDHFQGSRNLKLGLPRDSSNEVLGLADRNLTLTHLGELCYHCIENFFHNISHGWRQLQIVGLFSPVSEAAVEGTVAGSVWLAPMFSLCTDLS